VSFQETPKNTAPRRDFTFITTEELAAVAKSTRSRLTLAQVTTALQTLVGLIAEREKVQKFHHIIIFICDVVYN
jgi:hypothetical protein